MSSKAILVLPPLAPFPQASWRTHFPPEDWHACLDTWSALIQAHLSLPASEFAKRTLKDPSVPDFLVSFMKNLATANDSTSPVDLDATRRLRRLAFTLASRSLEDSSPPEQLLQWDVLADLSKIYGKKASSNLISSIWDRNLNALQTSMTDLKGSLIEELESGLKGRLDLLEPRLKRLNHLVHCSSGVAIFFMSGSEFLDGLISCYKPMNPPLRRVIIATTYLCLIGLTEGSKTNVSLLTDQLYTLKSAAEAHKAGPISSSDSLVAELVTVTPILKQVPRRLEESGIGSGRTKAVITSLSAFVKAGDFRPKRLLRRKLDKGKQINYNLTEDIEHQQFGDQIHVHRLSLISQIQDLFPDLGAGFVVKLLDEYNDDVESVTLHLLEESLPLHLKQADRRETLDTTHTQMADAVSVLALQPTPPLLPTRRNVFDDDELDQLAVDASRLHFGCHDSDRTADAMLKDRSSAPNKAAILSALAAFDSDDDERDDTYDVEDVGGTVDSAAPGNNPEEAAADTSHAFEELLFKTYKSNSAVFQRDTTARRNPGRASLKQATGMTDEAIEGWALMLSRDARQLRRLEAKYFAFSGAQAEIASTAWRADRGSGTEDSDVSGGGARGRGGYEALGRGRGRGGRRAPQGNVAGPSGDKGTEKARQRKEANKSSRANHNRRDQRARKMARGGFPG